MQNGEALEGNIMREPNKKYLRYSDKETKRIRSLVANAKKIKVTINIDEETLVKIRSEADDTGVPYQRLINQLLKASTGTASSIEMRLSALEAQVKRLSKKKAA